MKTPREVAHVTVNGSAFRCGARELDAYANCSTVCDQVTAAIAARDAEWAECTKLARDLLEWHTCKGQQRRSHEQAVLPRTGRPGCAGR